MRTTQPDPKKLKHSYAHEFASLAEFYAAGEQAAPSAPYFCAMRETDGDWHGTRSLEEAGRLARNGWPQGLDALQTARAAIPGLTSPRAFSPAPIIADEGDEIDVSRFLDGESDCWIDFPPTMQSATGRVIPLILNVSTSASVAAADMSARGAIALALCDALESAGYRVEIILFYGVQARDTDQTYTNRIIAKRAEDALDLAKMAFALVNPSICRRYMFLTTALHGDKTARFWHEKAQGYPIEMPECDRPEGAIYLPCMHRDSAKQAMKVAADTIAKLTDAA